MPCEYADILIEPKELTFEYELGSPYSIPKQSIKVRKVMGGGPLTPRWSATIDSDWVTMSRTAGQASATSISVGVYHNNRPAGEYVSTITFDSDTAENVPQYAIVRLFIIDPNPPEPEPEPVEFEESYRTSRVVEKEEPPEPPEPPDEEKSWWRRLIEWLLDKFFGISG